MTKKGEIWVNLNALDSIFFFTFYVIGSKLPKSKQNKLIGECNTI